MHWLWPSLVALGIAVAGGAVAIAATGGQGGSPPRTIVATQALVLVPASTSRAPAHPPTSSTSAVPLPARVGQLVTWPSGKRYTIVVAVVPVQAGLGEAKTEAEQAVRQGLENVGVLVSSSYSSLHPGYYLVFSGSYDTLEEAQSSLPRVRARFPSAFAQQVSR
ncbi:MAG: hypothetical protein C5B48_02955 [Candidatus Rokuibacteriota bacterium]|nr:MAG: hypothetical protein C5B48_02955 [Candidatus Rokubacteria bacterium]